MHPSDRIARFLAVVLAIATLLASFPALPAGAEETQLYVGHRARLSARIPASWTVPADGSADYRGTDGFVFSSILGGEDLEPICDDIAGIGFVSAVAPVRTTWNGAPACEVEGTYRGQDAAGIVIQRPEPIEAFGEEYRFAALIADPTHLESILASVSFETADVSPQEYVYSVLNIMEARAWYAPEVEWDRFREDDLGLIENAQTYEETHWVIRDALNSLRAWGDNHSLFYTDNSMFSDLESVGTGMILDGRVVRLVYPDSPAGRADIRVGDTVLDVDGQGYNGTRWIDDLVRDDATLTISRAGEEDPITVEIAPGSYSRYLPPIVQSVGPDIGYVELFSNVGANDVTYANGANSGIARVDNPAMCGWIVDLRRNGGGGYGPMVMGVGSILSDGELFSFERRDGETVGVVQFRDGRFYDSDGQESTYMEGVTLTDVSAPDGPVAVLIGPGTASAAELTAVAFIGRPDSRLFGVTTGGFTIGNNGYALFDGSELILAESTYVDRTGGTHIGGIVPDVIVETEWETYGTAGDPVIAAASAWLREQPGCDAATPVP